MTGSLMSEVNSGQFSLTPEDCVNSGKQSSSWKWVSWWENCPWYSFSSSSSMKTRFQDAFGCSQVKRVRQNWQVLKTEPRAEVVPRGRRHRKAWETASREWMKPFVINQHLPWWLCCMFECPRAHFCRDNRPGLSTRLRFTDFGLNRAGTEKRQQPLSAEQCQLISLQVSSSTRPQDVWSSNVATNGDTFPSENNRY